VNDRARWSEVAHGDLRLLNPLSDAILAETIEVLDLPIGATVVDVGCGRGEALIRICSRWRTRGVGIDLHEPYVEAARSAASLLTNGARVDFIVGDAAEYARDLGEPVDLAVCIGSSHAFGGGYELGLRSLAGLVERGGQVLLGEGFWRREPTPEYLDALGGATPDEFADYAGLIRTGIEAGLTPLYAVVAGERDWDRYEWTLVLNGERSGDPDVRAWVRAGRDRYLAPGGRETLGFGLFLFRRD
jgi:SAM-dependent methyltransferase